MLSRRAILILSIVFTGCLYLLLLWISPTVILMRSQRFIPTISQMYHVDLVEDHYEAKKQQPGQEAPALSEGSMDAEIMETEGTLHLDPQLTLPLVETPDLAERSDQPWGNDIRELTPEPETFQSVDARILEIAEETARKDIDIARRLVRPGPDFVLPEGALPALRSRNAAPEDIQLEPARIGPGFLVQTVPGPEDDDTSSGAEGAAFEALVFTPAPEEQTVTLPQLEQRVQAEPLKAETLKAKEESNFTFMDDLVDIHLDTYLPDPAEPGYFRLRILPKGESVLPATPKNVTFIVDASRSILQRKLDLTVRALHEVLDSFRPDDRFNLLLFRDTVTSFQENAINATPENILLAKQFLSGLESRGQTDVYNGLLPIAELHPQEDCASIILLISDGRPTTGVRDSREIINHITNINKLGNSIFAYGAGNTSNRYLMDLLAYRNKGEAFVSDTISTISPDLKAFAAQFADPLLININARYGKIIEEELYPRIIPDFFQDRPVTLYGRYQPGKDQHFVARITGYGGGRFKELLFRADLSQAQAGNDNVAHGWAFQKAYHLIGEISKKGELPELLDELDVLSRKYAITTIYSP